MTNDERFVIDTNVVVSAILSPRSIPRRAFDLAFKQSVVLASDATLNELDSVLRRPKFERYLSEGDRLRFLAKFIRDIIVIEVAETISDCRDPKDNKFLELAVSGGATGSSAVMLICLCFILFEVYQSLLLNLSSAKLDLRLSA